MDPAPETRPDAGIAARIRGAILGYPRLVVAIGLVSAAIAAWLGARNLTLDADTNSLIDPDRPFMRDYRAFLGEFGDLEYLWVVVDAKGTGPERTAAAEAAVDAVIAGLGSVPEPPAVAGRIEPAEQWRLASRAMPASDLAGLVLAREALPWLRSGEAGAVARAADDALGQAMSAEGLAAGEARQRELVAAATLAASALVGESELAKPLEADYLVSPSGRLRFVAILPPKDFSSLAVIDEPLRRIRGVLAEARRDHPSVEIGLTGKPVLQADELATSNADLTLASVLSLGVISVLFMVVFRGVRRPLLAIVAFGVGVGWTYGLAALLVGRLTLLSIVFLLVLVGAGLDYGVHLVSRYQEERRTRPPRDAAARTLATAARGTLTGALTSAAVFLLTLATPFAGLRELGIIAGCGLLACAIAMVTVLPALLVLFDAPGAIPPPAVEGEAEPRPFAGSPRRARLTLAAGAIAIAGAGAVAALGLRFESNLLELQSPELDSVRWEKRIIDDDTSASWFGAVARDDLAGVAAAVEAAGKEPEIGNTLSVLDLVAPQDEARLAGVASLGALASVPAPPSAPLEPRTLRDLAGRFRTLAALAAARAPEEAERFRGLASSLELLAGNPASAAAPVALAAAAATGLVEGSAASLREALPAALRDRLVAPSGRFLVSLVPARDTWREEPLEAFVAALRRVDPRATGVPITQSESIRDMRSSFVTVSLLSVVAVAVIAFLDFRRMGETLLAVGSLLAGITLTLGALTIAGLSLNLANFFAIPILIGLGIDSAIHLLHRARESGDEYGSTRNAVVFTSITTAIGFGALVTAGHRGLASLGWVMLIGSLACLFTTVVLLPAARRAVRR
jgi:predicted RND superfamily exporter protein